MDVCDRLKLPAHWERLRCVGGEAFPHAVCVCCCCVFHKRPRSGKTLWKYAAVLFFKLGALQWKQRESFRQEVDGGGGTAWFLFFWYRSDSILYLVLYVLWNPTPAWTQCRCVLNTCILCDKSSLISVSFFFTLSNTETQFRPANRSFFSVVFF